MADKRLWFDDPLVEVEIYDHKESVRDKTDTDDLPVILYDAKERPLRRRIGFSGDYRRG